MIRPTCSQKRREIKESRVVLLQGAVDFDFSLSSSFSIPFLCFFFFCFFCSFFLVGCNQYTNKAFSRCYLSFSLLFSTVGEERQIQRCGTAPRGILQRKEDDCPLYGGAATAPPLPGVCVRCAEGVANLSSPSGRFPVRP